MQGRGQARETLPLQPRQLCCDAQTTGDTAPEGAVRSDVLDGAGQRYRRIASRKGECGSSSRARSVVRSKIHHNSATLASDKGCRRFHLIMSSSIFQTNIRITHSRHTRSASSLGVSIRFSEACIPFVSSTTSSSPGRHPCSWRASQGKFLLDLLVRALIVHHFPEYRRVGSIYGPLSYPLHPRSRLTHGFAQNLSQRRQIRKISRTSFHLPGRSQILHHVLRGRGL